MASLPVRIAKPFGMLPFGAQKTILEAVLKQIFLDVMDEDELHRLMGRVIRIDIKDIALAWHFSLSQSGCIEVSKHFDYDARMGGDLASFITLCAQTEDPDTLFFQRRLSIEGDTEIALEIKNILDRISLKKLPPELRFLIQASADFIRAFPPPGTGSAI